MPDLSGAAYECRTGTAKNFTLLLLLYLTQPNRPGSNDSGCSDRIRPPDAGIIKRYFRVPALQAVAGGASCLKMLPVSAES